jgi:penicillin amidase
MNLIEAGANGHDVDSMTAILGDTYSLYGEVVTPVVLAAVEGEILVPAEQQVVDALSDWSFTCPTGLDGHDPAGPDSTDPVEAREARGCTAFHALLTAITHAALADEIAQASAASADGVTLVDRSDVHLVVRALRDPALLSSGELFWDDVSTTSVIETRQDVIMTALSLAAEQLAAVGDPDDWRWGRVHTFSLRSIYDTFGVTQYNDGPYAAPGGLYTVNVANPASTAWESGTPFDFGFVSGASVRFVVEVGPDGPRMSYQLPGGTDLHRDSPFYNQLLSRWLENEPVPFAFGPGAVPSPAIQILVSPAAGD